MLNVYTYEFLTDSDWQNLAVRSVGAVKGRLVKRVLNFYGSMNWLVGRYRCEYFQRSPDLMFDRTEMKFILRE